MRFGTQDGFRLHTNARGATTLRLLPLSTDCLKWSSECELAVAAEEHVELMIPKLNTSKEVTAESSHQLWETIHLRINLFEDDIPVEEPISFRSFSIGEELSVCPVVSISWSPSGLAAHRRCALAVLTSNLVLSIWASTDLPPANPSSWKRLLIVNRALESYYASLITGYVKDQKRIRSDALKRFQRIRCFSWSPGWKLASKAKFPNFQNSQYIAIANDERMVIILQVSSPSQNPFAIEKGEWQATAVLRFTVEDTEHVQRPDQSCTFEDYMKHDCYIHSLAWSPWKTCEDGTMVSMIAYAIKTHIGFRRILLSPHGAGTRMTTEEIKFKDNFPCPAFLNGPFLWTPKPEHDCVTLISCTNDELVSCSLNLTEDVDPTIFRRRRGEWGDVAGLAISPLPSAPSGNSLLHWGPHISLRDNTPTMLVLPGLTRQTENLALWQDRVLTQQSIFRLNNAGPARTSLWGLACSPLGDLIATAFSLQPRTEPIYLIWAEYSTTLMVQPIQKNIDDVFELPMNPNFEASEGLPAESIGFSMKYWAATHDPAKRFLKTTRVQMVRAIVKSFNLEREPNHEIPSLARSGQGNITADPMMAIAKLRAVMNSKLFILQRVERLVSTILEGSRIWSPEDAPVFQKLAISIKDLSVHFRMDELSTRILRGYQAKFAVGNAELNTTSSEGDAFQHADDEKCHICEAEVNWLNSSEAACTNGHQFARCGLTFLTIQVPGISKFCGICGKQYLNEMKFPTGAKVAVVDPQEDVDMDDISETSGATDTNPATMTYTDDDGTSRSLVSLALILFTACDICIYCGGKFIG